MVFVEDKHAGSERYVEKAPRPRIIRPQYILPPLIQAMGSSRPIEYSTGAAMPFDEECNDTVQAGAGTNKAAAGASSINSASQTTSSSTNTTDDTSSTHWVLRQEVEPWLHI